MSLSIADLLFGVMVFVMGVGELIFNGFRAGKLGALYQCNPRPILTHSLCIIGCLLNEALIVFSLGASILSVSAMTLHRYLIVVRRVHLTRKQAFAFLSGIWIGLAVVVCLFLSLGDMGTVVSLQSSGQYCFIAMHRWDTVSLLASLLVLLFIVGTMVFIVCGYYYIVKRYFYLKKEAKRRQEVSAKHPADSIKEIEEAQHYRKQFSPVALILQIRLKAARNNQSSTMGYGEIKLLKKAIAIAGSFVFIWVFLVVKIIYEVSNQEPVAMSYDSLIEIMFTAYPIFNGVILYLYDEKCRNNIQDLFSYKSAIARIKSMKMGLQNRNRKDLDVNRAVAARHENLPSQKLLLIREVKVVNAADTVMM